MQISNEVLIGMIAIVSTVATGYVYWLKRRADVALEKAKAAKRESDARAEQVETDAKARLMQVQAETNQSQNIMKLFEQQIIINQQAQEDRNKWWDALEKKEKRDEGNYRHLADTQRDNTAMLLTEIQNQNARFDTKALKMQEETRSIIHWEMVNAVTDSQKQYSQRDIVKLIGRGEGIPFPREHGYVFRKCTVRIKSEKGLNMFPAPLYIDQKPVGRLFDGDEVWIMQDVPFPAGWSAVRAMNLGVNGWVDKAFIAIENCTGELVKEPA